MSPQEYSDGFSAYHEQVIKGDHDSLLGVNLMKEYFWSGKGALNYEATRNHTISQDLPDWYKVTNSIYMAPRQQILAREYFVGDNPLLQNLSKLAAVDIDYIEDYRIAQALYAVYAEDGELTGGSDEAGSPFHAVRVRRVWFVHGEGRKERTKAVRAHGGVYVFQGGSY